MNAQEAIDLMERELENYKAMYKKHKKEQTTLEQFYKNKVDALSIILESAKLFHEHSVPRMFSELRPGLGEQECKNIKTVYGVPIESVGIEVEQ